MPGHERPDSRARVQKSGVQKSRPPISVTFPIAKTSENGQNRNRHVLQKNLFLAFKKSRRARWVPRMGAGRSLEGCGETPRRRVSGADLRFLPPTEFLSTSRWAKCGKCGASSCIRGPTGQSVSYSIRRRRPPIRGSDNQLSFRLGPLPLTGFHMGLDNSRGISGPKG